MFAGKVVIATPFYNLAAYSPYVQSLVDTVRVCDRMGINVAFMPLHGDSYVGRARNTIVARFLEDKEATDLFFIDSDESWDVKGFMRVLFCPAEVVGAAYRMKNNWEGWTATPTVKDGQPIGYLISENEAILEADQLPCGFLKIKRTAFEKIQTAHPELKYHDAGSDPTSPGRDYYAYFECSTRSGIYVGEDFGFCKLWRDMGEKLWLEPLVDIYHFGVQGHGGVYDQWLRANRDKQKRDEACAPLKAVANG